MKYRTSIPKKVYGGCHENDVSVMLKASDSIKMI